MTDRITIRLWALVNVALIPYVWAKFPSEAASYSRRSFKAFVFGVRNPR